MATRERAQKALWSAAGRLAVRDMREALDAGADPALPSEHGWTAAERVCAALGADVVGEATRTALQLSALQLLAEHGGLDAATATAALFGAGECNTAVVAKLIDAGADVRHADIAGRTALHCVRRAGIVPLLVAAGGDLNAANKWGGRPLHDCLDEGGSDKEDLPEVIGALIAAGADVNAVNSRGETPLFFAAARATTCHWMGTAVRMLLAAGADPTIATSSALTPLATSREVLADVVQFTPTDVEPLAACKEVMALLAPAEAWWRRRHALLAVRGQYGGASAVVAESFAAGSAGASSDAFSAATTQ